MSTKISRVFVSHAKADKDYVDGFVTSVLMRGAGLRPSDIFYSSAPDTGVRSGQNLMEVVRNEAGKSLLIIALVTPTYQTRPVCVAELGAAWSREVLLPIMAPAMKRSELEGVLPGMLIQPADNDDVLNDLADRIRELGFEFSARSWGVGLEQWKSFLRNNPNVVEKPFTPTADEMKQLKKELDSARAALDESEKARNELVDRVDRLKEAKSVKQVLEADLPTDERARFEALSKAAKLAVRSMPKVVVDGLWHKVSSRPMLMPNRADDYFGQDSAEEQVKAGRLEYDEDTGEIYLADEYPDVRKALEATEALANFFEDPNRTEGFTLWFEDKFQVPMNLKKKGCWDELL